MARPQKKGLDYFPLDVDFFSDPKIRILKVRFGADGITIYLYLLCQIYRNGYYIKANEDFQWIMADELRMSIEKVKQVMKFLLERSLFDGKLFQSDTILTSAGIQRRFQLAVKERAKKKSIKIDGFWLLKEEETEPFIKCTLLEDYSGKNGSKSEKNDSKSKEESLKERKGKKSTIYRPFGNPKLEEAFKNYLQVQKQRGHDLTNEQIKLLREKIPTLSSNEQEQIEIVKNAAIKGWNDFYPLRKNKKNTGNQFHNFEQRKYDYQKLEEDLIKKVNGIGG